MQDAGEEHVMTGPTTLLSVEDAMDVHEKPEPPVTTKELFRFARGSTKVQIFFGCVGACIVGAGLPIFTYLFGKIVQDASASGDTDDVADNISYWAGWLAIAAGAAFIAGAVMMICFLLSGERQISLIRKLYFESLLSQEPGWFDLQKAGALTQRLHGDTQVIYKGIAEQAGFFFMHLVTIIASYTIGFIASWRLTLVLLATVPVLAGSGMAMQYALTSLTTETRAAYSKAGGVAEESLTAIRTVHAFSAHTAKLAEYTQHLQAALDKSKFSGVVQGAGIGSAMFIFFSVYGVGFYYASYLIIWELSSMGDILTAFFAIVIGSFSFAQVGPPIAAFAAAKGAARRVFAVIDRKPRIHEGTKHIEHMKGEIEIENLTFRYPSRTDTPVFTNLNMKIKEGQTVGLVGLSGCGKSSIVSLVQRFYEPADAHFAMVLLNGKEKSYPYESNLTLLETFAALEEGNNSTEVAEITLPIVATGGKVVTCKVTFDTSGSDKMSITHTVPDTDGKVRHESGMWYWVEELEKGEKTASEHRLPLTVCEQLNTALKAGTDSVEVDLAFGRYSIATKALTRTNVPSEVSRTVNGQVYIDGIPINELDIKWWRDQIGMVTQEPILFVGTILENIKAGRPEATMEEVVEAAKKANIHHTIVRWPDSYNTKVGEGGCQLSGGQKQRIAIARAIIKKPRILLLDEATSALDRASEVKVQEALDIVMNADEGGHKPTTIIIAHRLQTVVKADQIFVMKPPGRGQENKGGVIAEKGTHSELVAKSGVCTHTRRTSYDHDR